jgi:hypothetical protein
MAPQSKAISLFDAPVNQLPAHLAGFTTGIGTDLVLGGIGRNKLGLKGNRFRLIVNGQEEAVLETNSLSVIIVGAAPGVGRLYYAGDYVEGEKTHPLCYSADGVVPGNDVLNPQSTKCANCPQNVKGSKITRDGAKTKACSYFKRLAVVLTEEQDPQHRIFQLDGKAMTIFGEGEPAQNKFTLNEYGKKLSTRGWDPAHLVTKLSFDTTSSVPKLYFSPERLLTEDEAPWVQDVCASDEVKLVTTITAITDASDAETEVPAAETPVEDPTPVQAKPAARTATPAAAQPKPVAPKPAPAVAAPKTQAKPTPPVTIVKATPVVQETATGDSELDAFLAEMGGD